MKNKSLQTLFVFLTLLAQTFSSQGITPASAQSAADLPAAGQFINADGSLNLTTGYSGGLDVSNYNVTLDPARGPVFSPLVVTANAWNALGTGLNAVNADASAIAISGTDVYVGGNFTDAGGVAANNIAKWDGSTWSALGSGMNNYVNAIAVSGTDVYVGGAFTEAGGVADTSYIAKWNGSTWSALGTGMPSDVTAIAVSGTDVYVGGHFTNAGGDPNADRIAKWDGSAWSALGPLNSSVYAVAASGTDVYVGGLFTNAGNDPNADYIAKWDGSAWSALGGTPLSDSVSAIALSGTDVYVGGFFTDAGNDLNADYIAKWDPAANSGAGGWSALGTGANIAVNWVNAIAVSGTDVYAGGRFSFMDGVEHTNNIAKWNGSSWSALGTGLNNDVKAIAVNGMGAYTGGYFTDAGGDVNADYIALHATCATPVTVTSGADSGTGSLREALANVCPGGTITFDNDYHILLDSTLAVTKNMTIDGETHKIILDGQDTVRVMYTEWSPVTATVRNLTIQNGNATTSVGVIEKAGGGILNLGKLNVENVTFSNNTAVDYGGALYARDITWVVNSTFSGNSASYGGAISDGSDGYSTGMVIHNTTFSGNSATGSGGAIEAILGSVHIHNSIIANSISGGNCVGGVVNAGPNLDSGSTCGFGLSNTDPKLAPLADNGGPTPTFALLSGSPALDAGSNFMCSGAAVGDLDQRGATRPQGVKCDLGSYEAFVVTNANDSGAGSLRQNLADVIPNGPIIFDNDYHILLESTLAVTKDLTIDGSGHAIILDGQDTVRVMYTEWAPVSATVKNLTIQNGNATTFLGVASNAGGGILNLGSLQVENVNFIHNNAVDAGGALYSYDSDLTVVKSTFSNNSATDGGGIYLASGTATVTSSTFAGNSATSGGGTYLYSGTATVTSSTLAENSATLGGGIFSFGGTLHLQNTIIANSISGGDCVGSTASDSNNLIESSGSFDCGLTNGTNGNIIGSDPNLGPLANNGGSTLTFSLLVGSPAINAGTDSGCPASDQRGVARPQGSHCDIGSFEYRYPIFVDVPLDYSVNSYIERLYNAGITGGCSLVPLMYCPENTVTRAQMAVFLLRGIHGSSYVPPAVGAGTGFADVPTNHPVAAWIKQLAAEGITGGCSGGNYCPDATVTRAQMAVFLLRSKYTSAYTPPPANGDFTDVPLDHLMVAWIEQLAAEGITGGCGAGVYCPDGNVTRAQMAVFLVRTFNLP